MHQPSSKILKLFDDIIVMADGNVIYCGAQSQMISYFESEGFQYPEYYNPADFVLEVVSKEYSTDIDKLIIKNNELYGGYSSGYRKLEEEDNILFIKAGTKENDVKQDISLEDYKVGDLRQLVILTKRSLICMWRDLVSS